MTSTRLSTFFGGISERIAGALLIFSLINSAFGYEFRKNINKSPRASSDPLAKKCRESSSKHKIFRWIVTLLIILFLLVWSSYYGLHCSLPEAEHSPTLYANQVDDNLQRIFLKAIDSAESSITLYIYSISDVRIIQALQRKKREGVSIKVLYDPSAQKASFAKLSESVETLPIKMRGLMHKKILIIDERSVWIGSANFTTESLRLHDNLVVGAVSPELAATILADKQHHHFTIGDQMTEFWSFPESAKEGLDRLITLINEATLSIRVGMFTWTHPDITQAVIEAAQRGVKVEVVVDRAQTNGVNKKAVAALLASPIEVRVNRGNELFHHKFAIIDDTILVNGSANWTRSAFGRNGDCFLILHNLERKQQKKLHRLWHIIRSTSDLADKKHLLIFWKRPSRILSEELEKVDMVA